MSPEEIGSFLEKRTFDGADDDHVLAFLADRRDRITARVADLQKLIAFVDAKMAWLKDPAGGDRPPFPG